MNQPLVTNNLLSTYNLKAIIPIEFYVQTLFMTSLSYL